MVFDLLVSMIFLQTNVETQGKKSPPVEIQTETLTYYRNNDRKILL